MKGWGQGYVFPVNLTNAEVLFGDAIAIGECEHFVRSVVIQFLPAQ